MRQSATMNVPEIPTDLSPDAVTGITTELRRLLGRCFQPLPENQKFPLAHVGAPLPRLPPVAG